VGSTIRMTKGKVKKWDVDGVDQTYPLPRLATRYSIILSVR